MKLGDRMMIKNVRFLVVAAPLCVLLGSGLPAMAEAPLSRFLRPEH